MIDVFPSTYIYVHTYVYLSVLRLYIYIYKYIHMHLSYTRTHIHAYILTYLLHTAHIHVHFQCHHHSWYKPYFNVHPRRNETCIVVLLGPLQAANLRHAQTIREGVGFRAWGLGRCGGCLISALSFRAVESFATLSLNSREPAKAPTNTQTVQSFGCW